MPLVLTHPTCQELPAQARRAVCEETPAALTLAVAGDRKLVIGVHVDDGRPYDGPYIERSTYWASWKKDADAYTVDEFLTGIGPVADAADAYTRLSLVAGEMNDATSAVALTAADVTPHLGHLGEFVATSSYTDSLSCECSVTWTKTYRVDFRITVAGTITHSETMTSCAAWPESETAKVCGALKL